MTGFGQCMEITSQLNKREQEYSNQVFFFKSNISSNNSAVYYFS